VAESAEAVAAWCATVVVYEDSDRRGRRAGEMAELIAGVLRRARPGITCELADGPEQALRRAVALAGGAPVLFVYEKLAAARAALDAIGATPWPDAAPTAGRPGVQRPGVQGPGVQGPDPQQDIAAQVDEVLAAAGGMTAGGAFSGGTAPADASADYERRSGDDEPESDQAAVPA